MSDPQRSSHRGQGAAERLFRERCEELASDPLDPRGPSLPLARIRRLMRVEEGARHIALEVPFLYAKVTEFFVEELTARAWEITREKGRNIIQYEDLMRAIKSADIYDFLLHMVS